MGLLIVGSVDQIGIIKPLLIVLERKAKGGGNSFKNYPQNN